MSVNVFEKESGKWVLVDGATVTYVSDREKATVFDIRALHGANQLEDFYLYRKTMLAVPEQTNQTIVECSTVREYLADQKDVSDYQTYGY